MNFNWWQSAPSGAVQCPPPQVYDLLAQKARAEHRAAQGKRWAPWLYPQYAHYCKNLRGLKTMAGWPKWLARLYINLKRFFTRR